MEKLGGGGFFSNKLFKKSYGFFVGWRVMVYWFPDMSGLWGAGGGGGQ